MTAETKRSCRNCKNHSFCHLYQSVRKRLVIAAGMFRDRSNPATDIFSTLAGACNQYQKQEEA